MLPLEVLVVDDEPAIRQVLAAAIKQAGHRVAHVGDARSAIQQLASGNFDTCICDLRLPDMDGLEIIRRAKSAGVETQFLVMTAYASVDTAIEAMKCGAYDYLTKPLRNEDVLRRLDQIAEFLSLKAENRQLRSIVEGQRAHEFESASQAMRQVEEMAEKVARTLGSVLITGESGTGKSFIARKICDLSARRRAPFVSVNCGAIPEGLMESEFFGHIKGAFTGADRVKKGLFRQADGGTLFLDEVAELPLSLQVKLLHVLEERVIRPVGGEQVREVDVRIIAATNRNIEEMVESGEFREDLYYRLNVIHMQMPALRERREDLPGLVHYFMQSEGRKLDLHEIPDIDPAAEELLVKHAWPGNLREMQNMITRALIMADGSKITIADLPPAITRQTSAASGSSFSPGVGNQSLRELVRRYEIEVINEAVRQQNGDRQAVAKQLDIGLSTLYRKLEEND
ncbi:MAG TPA: sigma-54-dependent Fis family transcriptional regulator [Gammaproteobacteria bacterium]|nr:sigma-54-dependent Fis family transcriptional regulator [Gammaproteobacteria bacterium]